MAYEVEWAESAVASLIDAIESIARDSPSYAAVFAVRVAAAEIRNVPRVHTTVEVEPSKVH